MPLKPTMMFYPTESYNCRSRAEERWENDARTNLNNDGWQISIKNGKRLRRHWTRNGGFAMVPTKYGETPVYNEQYDVELNRAKREQYDLAFQPDGDEDFFTTIVDIN